DIRKPHLHLSAAHEHTQCVAVAHPYERSIEYTFVAGFGRFMRASRCRSALGMAMTFVRSPIEVTAFAIDVSRMCVAERERQGHGDAGEQAMPKEDESAPRRLRTRRDTAIARRRMCVFHGIQRNQHRIDKRMSYRSEGLIARRRGQALWLIVARVGGQQDAGEEGSSTSTARQVS